MTLGKNNIWTSASNAGYCSDGLIGLWDVFESQVFQNAISNSAKNGIDASVTFDRLENDEVFVDRFKHDIISQFNAPMSDFTFECVLRKPAWSQRASYMPISLRDSGDESANLSWTDFNGKAKAQIMVRDGAAVTSDMFDWSQVERYNTTSIAYTNSAASGYVNGNHLNGKRTVSEEGRMMQAIKFASDNTILGRHYPVYFKCIRLYSRALTSAEIKKNYDVDRSRFALT